MPLHIDRVQAEMHLLRKPDDAAPPGVRADDGESRDALARRLRPIVIDILRDHLRDLERRGVV